MVLLGSEPVVAGGLEQVLTFGVKDGDPILGGRIAGVGKRREAGDFGGTIGRGQRRHRDQQRREHQPGGY